MAKPRHTRGTNVLGAARTQDQVLADEIGKFFYDPLGYVMFAFPWDTDTSVQIVELAPRYKVRFPNCKYGPDEWACEFLDQVGDEAFKRGFDGKKPVDPQYYATVSGHEIGKSCLVAWLTKWILDTRPYSKGTLTAVTDEQLRTKTWAEVGKWHRRSVTSHWFDWNSSRGNMSLVHVAHDDWRADARTCREEKSESFAGQHAPGATSFYIFDEASGVPNKVFEVREGGLTSGEPMVFDFGNGTRSSGQFYEECVGKLSKRYIVRSIDSRLVSITNKQKIARDAEDYGEDSDFFRVRWRGLFPETGLSQFIPAYLVEEAMSRDLPTTNSAALVLGVDCARMGDDSSVIWPRKGVDARTWNPEQYTGLTVDQLLGHIINKFQYFKGMGEIPAAIFVDQGDIGAAVVDFLLKLGYPAIGVRFGSSPIQREHYRYKADELWGNMRDALTHGLCLPSRDSAFGDRIFSDLTQREYGFMKGTERIHMEPKPDMKARGLPSCDFADALGTTYAQEVADTPANMQPAGARSALSDYDPYAMALGGVT